MAFEINRLSRYYIIHKLLYPLNDKATLEWEYTPDRFDGNLVDESGNLVPSPHRFSHFQEVRIEVCGKHFYGRIYAVTESPGAENVIYTAYDYLHELQKMPHNANYSKYNSTDYGARNGQNIREILEAEFSGSTLSFDWSQLNKIEYYSISAGENKKAYPYELEPYDYSPVDKTHFQVIKEVLAYNPALAFYYEEERHPDLGPLAQFVDQGSEWATKKKIVVVNVAEHSESTYEIQMRGETDVNSVQITTDARNTYNAVRIETQGKIQLQLEVPERIWDPDLLNTDGSDKRPGANGLTDPGVAYNPVTQPDRYRKYKLSKPIHPWILEYDSTGTLTMSGRIMYIFGPVYVFDKGLYHGMVNGTKYDENLPQNITVEPWLDPTIPIPAVWIPYQENEIDAMGTGPGWALSDAAEVRMQDWGDATRTLAIIESVGDPAEETWRGIFWTDKPLIVQKKIAGSKKRAQQEVNLYREVGHEVIPSGGDKRLYDALRVAYSAKLEDYTVTAYAKERQQSNYSIDMFPNVIDENLVDRPPNRAGVGTKVIKTDYMIYYARDGYIAPAYVDDPDSQPDPYALVDNTEEAERLANFARDYYCRVSVSGSMNFHKVSTFEELPFWLGWNIGVGDSAVKSIDLAPVLKSKSIPITFESHRFGYNDSKCNRNSQRVQQGGKPNIAQGASTTLQDNGIDVTDIEEEEGIVVTVKGIP